MALKADKMDELIDERDKSGLVRRDAFMVGYHPRWHKVTGVMADNDNGPIRQVQSAFT